MMARVLAVAREQIVALGGASLALGRRRSRRPPAPSQADGAAAGVAAARRGGRARARAAGALEGRRAVLHRLQEELMESRGERKRLAEQVST